MPEEIGKTLENLKNTIKVEFGDLTIYSGEWNGVEVSEKIKINLSIAWSGWGKVSAARATTRLLSSNLLNSPIDLLIFTGVAGAVNSKLNQWDIVIPSGVIQHDMDARPLFERYVIPALNQKKLMPKRKLINWARKAIQQATENFDLKLFGKVSTGIIATGDSFISDKLLLKNLSINIPDLDAVEMEGAAFAQVAIQENIDWIIIRTISDSADEEAANSFSEFVRIYENSSFKLIEILIRSLKRDLLNINKSLE